MNDKQDKLGELIIAHLKNHGYLLLRIAQDFLKSCVTKAEKTGISLERAAKATAEVMADQCNEDGEFFSGNGEEHIASMKYVGKEAASHASILGKFQGPSDVMDHVISMLEDESHPNHAIAYFTLPFAMYLGDQGWTVEHLDPEWIQKRVFSAVKRGQIREDTIKEAAWDAIEAGGEIKFKDEVMVRIVPEKNE